MTPVQTTLVIAADFLVLNRARGSKLFNETDSTSLGRIVSTLLMGLTVYLAEVFNGVSAIHATLACLWTFGMLFLWAVFGWGKYFIAVTGNLATLSEKENPLVDWIMSFFPTPTTVLTAKLWGAVAMGLRQGFAIPCIVGLALLDGKPWNALFALFTLLFGLIYFAAGFISQKWAIEIAEAATGAAMGALIGTVLS